LLKNREALSAGCASMLKKSRDSFYRVCKPFSRNRTVYKLYHNIALNK
jgi:hypothetical protein